MLLSASFSLLLGARFQFELMENRSLGLVVLSVKNVFFEPWYTPEQVCVDDFLCDVHEVFHGHRRSLRHLPFAIHCTTAEADTSTARTVVLQILDSTALFIGDHKFEPHLPGKHLFELQVVAWTSDRVPEEVVMEPRSVFQKLEDQCLHLILDRSFEVHSVIDGEARYLAMVMTKSRYWELQRESMILKAKIDEDLDAGYQVAFGLTLPDARENQKMASKGRSAGQLVYGALQVAEFSLQPVIDFEVALPFLKRFAFAGYPRPLSIVQEVGKTSIYKFLKSS